MGKHSAKEWIGAVRPWSFPASAMPVIVTLGYLFAFQRDVSWVNGVWALLNIVVFHAAGNTWSDYLDYRRGVDSDDTFGVRTLTSGMFRPGEIFMLSSVLLTVAVLGGIGLWLRTGMPLLYIGLAGVACTVFYPALKYNAMGDFVIFVAYALLPSVGTVYACTLQMDWNILYIAVPVGLITVAILHGNNTRDIRTDKRANIRTLAMKIGAKASIWIYCLEILVPFLWISISVVVGILPVWCLLVWTAIFPALKNVRTALSFFRNGPSAISGLDQATAQLQLIFSAMLALALLVAGILA